MRKEETRKFQLDFSGCTTWGEIYAVIKNELELPQWCGENIDALWDALTGLMYVPAEIAVGRAVANKNLIPVVEQIIAVMHKAEAAYGEITVIEEN